MAVETLHTVGGDKNVMTGPLFRRSAAFLSGCSRFWSRPKANLWDLLLGCLAPIAHPQAVGNVRLLGLDGLICFPSILVPADVPANITTPARSNNLKAIPAETLLNQLGGPAIRSTARLPISNANQGIHFETQGPNFALLLARVGTTRNGSGLEYLLTLVIRSLEMLKTRPRKRAAAGLILTASNFAIACTVLVRRLGVRMCTTNENLRVQRTWDGCQS